MAEWQKLFDEGLKRQYGCIFVATKSMPHFKAKKYEVGMILIKR
jgi:DNA topoisomerase VI subunit A